MGINFSYDLKEVIAVIKNLCDEKQIYSLGISSEQDKNSEGMVEIYNKDRVSISYCIVGDDDDSFKVIYLEILGLYEIDFQAIRCVFDGKLLWDTLAYLHDRSLLIEEFNAQEFDNKVNAEFEKIWNKE